MKAETKIDSPLSGLSFVLGMMLLLLQSTRVSIGAEGASTGSRRQPELVYDTRWEAVFTRTDGWTGGDVAATVELHDGRILWLFGDSLIGSIREGKRTEGTRMINNAIAIHPRDGREPWRPPAPSDVQFYWGKNDPDGKPTAWIAPAGPSHDWFWPTGGGVEFPQGNESRLLLFLFRVRHIQHGKGVWNFQVVGTTLAAIANVRAPLADWRPRLIDIPQSMVAVARDRAELETLWGLMVCVMPRSDAGRPSDLLIYGTRRGGRAVNDLLLARVPCDAVEQANRWQFFAGDGQWVSDPKEARGIADGAVSEFSIEPHEKSGETRWLFVQSEPFLGRRIFGRAARRPEGPWSQPATLAAVPEVERSRQFFTYAAKGHLLISRPGEILVTYLVNSQNFPDLFHDTSIYRPRFLRIPLKQIVGP